MNIANILTLTRIFLVPFFVLFMMVGNENSIYFVIALAIFIIASITDAIDGKIARKYNLVTNFGKFMDPLADKILVMSAFLCLLYLGIVNVVLVIIILSREFLVTSLRLVASSNGKVIAANFWGKLKTVSQMITIIFCLIETSLPFNINLYIISNILVLITTIITVMSGIIYLWQNRKFISDISF